MKVQINKASAKSAQYPKTEENSDDSSKLKKAKNKIFNGKYRKLFRNVKYLTAVMSFLMTLLKLLQELGLIP